MRPAYPEDAAGQTSPFLDVLTAGMSLEDRFSEFFTVGLQGGAYLGARVRLAARLLMFVSQPRDELEGFSGVDSLPAGYHGVASDEPAIVFGASIGAAPLVRRNFIFAPGLAFLRSDVADYGSFVGLSLPFEWVTDDGARFGFEIDVGRAFGGTVVGRCENPPCALEDEQEYDRASGPAFYGAFQFGWGFNHPPPQKPAE